MKTWVFGGTERLRLRWPRPPADNRVEGSRLATRRATCASWTLGASLDPESVEGGFVLDGYRFAIDTLNAASSVREYRLVLYDDDGENAQVTTNYERLIAEGVDFLLGPYGSGATLEAARVANAAKIPLVEANGASRSIFDQGYEYVFGVLTPADRYFTDVVDLARDRAADSVAILSADGDAFSASAAAGAAARAEALGLSVVSRTYDASATDFSAALAGFDASPPDLLLGATHYADSVALTSELERLNVSPKLIGLTVGPVAPQYEQTLGSIGHFVVSPAQWTEELSTEGTDPWGTAIAFAAAVRAAIPAYADGEVPYQLAESSAAVIVLDAAIEAANGLDPLAVRNALAGLSMETFYGPIDFDERGVNAAKSMAVVQIFPDGQPHLVHPGEELEQELWYPAPSWAERAEGLAAEQAAVETDLAAFSEELGTGFPQGSQIVDELTKYLEKHPNYYGAALAVIGDNGKVTTSPYVFRGMDGLTDVNLAVPSYDIDAQPWLATPRDSGEPSWSDPYFDAGGGDIWMITYSVPLLGKNGVDAVVTTDLPLRHELPVLDVPGSCDIVSQDCAGGAQPKCAVVFGAKTEATCVAETGELGQGDACTVDGTFGIDDCGAGTMCTRHGTPDTDPAERKCQTLCLVRDDCTADEQCVTLTQNMTVGFGICLPTCDVFSSTCSEGTSCIPVYAWDNSQSGACLAPTGDGAAGSDCETGYDCAPGTGCFRTHPSEQGTCAALCGASHACTTGTCDLESTATGSAGFGYCR